MAAKKKSAVKKTEAKKLARPAYVCKQVLVVGLGLIGASFAKALKNNHVCGRVLGSTRSDKTLKTAIKSKIIDEGGNDLVAISAKLNKGDVILIATPTLSVPEKLSMLKDALARGVIVTDAASVKGDIAQKAVKIFGKLPEHLVLGHPIAGSEKSGIEAVNPALYERHRVILTPTVETNKTSLRKVERLWQRVGAQVSFMGVEEHDRVLAATSHLPHVLAFSLVDALAKRSERKDIFTYAAGGFRDFTRIAGSDPQMWHDIVIANRVAILMALDRFDQSLSELRSAIEHQDSKLLLEIFSDAKNSRDQFSSLNPSIKK
jgi:prephenate dehydrogenase